MNDASVMIDGVLCDVEEVTGVNTCTLNSVMCPPEDKTAETITIFQRAYPLPLDLVSLDRPMERDVWALGDYLPLAEILRLQQYDFTTGDVRFYSVGPAEGLMNALALHVWPASDATEEHTFPYRRRGRELRYSGHDTAETQGTISVDGSATVVGVGTAFDASMVNSIFRVGSSTTLPPTGLEGPRPWLEQRAMKSVVSGLELTLDAAVETSRSGVKYVITDPVDLDAGPYYALLAEAKKELAVGDPAYPTLLRAASEALQRAKEANSPVSQRRFIGGGQRSANRLADNSNVDIEW
jgi:hypothetical protein